MQNLNGTLESAKEVEMSIDNEPSKSLLENDSLSNEFAAADDLEMN